MIREWRDIASIRCTIFVVANMAVCFLIFDLAILPIRSFFDERDAQIAEKRAILARLSAVAAQESSVQALARQTEAAKNQNELLRGTNDGVINADLQTRLKAMVQATGARLRSVRNLPPSASDEIKYIGAQVEISGPIRAIHQTVHAIESAKPYLFIVGAVIKPAPQINPQAANGGGSVEPALDAQLDIVGAVQPEARN